MIILGLDCASKQSSVCVMKNDKIIYTAVQAANVTHSQNLLQMVQGALTVCSVKAEDIGLYAVTDGPGSFTGIRIGLAAVKGMAAANNTPCIGVSSLKALAESVILPGVVIPAFDARRNQVYACAVDSGNVLIDDFCRDVGALEEFVKNSHKNIFFVGDGKALCYNVYSKYPCVKPCAIDMPCIAAGACRLARKEYRTSGGQSQFQLTPSYLRLSQAERELKEKTEGKK